MIDTTQAAPATVAPNAAATPAPAVMVPQQELAVTFPRGQQLEMIDLEESTANVFEVVTRTRDVTNSFGVVTGKLVASQTIRPKKGKDIAKLLGLEGKSNVDKLASAKLEETDKVKHLITQRVVQLDSDDRFTGKEATVSFPKNGVRVVTFKLVEVARPDKLQKEINDLCKAFGKTEDEILAMMKSQMEQVAKDTIDTTSTTTRDPEPAKAPEAPKAPVSRNRRP